MAVPRDVAAVNALEHALAAVRDAEASLSLARNDGDGSTVERDAVKGLLSELHKAAAVAKISLNMNENGSTAVLSSEMAHVRNAALHASLSPQAKMQVYGSKHVKPDGFGPFTHMQIPNKRRPPPSSPFEAWSGRPATHRCTPSPPTSPRSPRSPHRKSIRSPPVRPPPKPWFHTSTKMWTPKDGRPYGSFDNHYCSASYNAKVAAAAPRSWTPRKPPPPPDVRKMTDEEIEARELEVSKRFAALARVPPHRQAVMAPSPRQRPWVSNSFVVHRTWEAYTPSTANSLATQDWERKQRQAPRSPHPPRPPPPRRF